MAATLDSESSSTERSHIDSFLHFLAQDMTAHPERLQAADAGLLQRIGALVESVDVDFDELLPKDVE